MYNEQDLMCIILLPQPVRLNDKHWKCFLVHKTQRTSFFRSNVVYICMLQAKWVIRRAESQQHVKSIEDAKTVVIAVWPCSSVAYFSSWCTTVTCFQHRNLTLDRPAKQNSVGTREAKGVIKSNKPLSTSNMDTRTEQQKHRRYVTQ